jgi:hypothetical protein
MDVNRLVVVLGAVVVMVLFVAHDAVERARLSCSAEGGPDPAVEPLEPADELARVPVG